MASIDDDGAQKPPVHTIGEDLTAMSLDELDERIGWLRQEIDRIEEAVRQKRASAEAAEAFFKSTK